MEVRDKRCNQCLLSKKKVVSDKKRDQILSTCAESGEAFECHKGTIAGRKIVCRGFFDQNLSLVIRLAKLLGRFAFVNEEDRG